jgi:PAS domain S-box-containing protein
MQNQNLLTREFSEPEIPQTANFISFQFLLYFGALSGILLLAYETRSYWSPTLVVSALLTVSFIGLIFVRQMTALRSKIGLIEKITAQKEELKFDNLIKDSSDITAIFRVDGVSLFLSPSIRNVLGYNHKVSIGTQSFDFIHPDDLEMVKQSYRRAYEDPDYVFTHEFRYKHLNGTWRVLVGVGRQYCDERGNVIGILHNSHDITERKMVEKQLRNYTYKLEKSNRELQEFAYVASHDLQEPLRKVQAFGDRLEKKCAAQLSDEGRDYVNRMRTAANRMQNLINDLLTFSRVATKTQPFQPVDLKKIAEEVVSDLEIRIEQSGGRVEIGKLPTLEADTLQMRQLFQNLIGNALKFHRADEKPVVRVFAETVSPNGASFSLNGEELQIGGNESFCRIAVEDNGIGFDEKYLDRIFTVFQRLHGRAEYEGSGIGLAVCRKIVERHGGQITAVGKPGKGATFYIDLPLVQEDTNIHETKC